MRYLIAAALTGTALLAATPAFAQDAEAERAPFSGVYVGGSVGYDVQPNDVGSSILFDRNLDGRFGDIVTTAAGANAFSPGFCNGAARTALPAGGCRNDKDGIGYSARLGMDVQRGNIVLGAVGEFGKSNIRDSVSGFSTTPANYVLSREIDWEGSIRGRAGYAANTTLFYATGGVGYARIARDFTSTNVANSFTQRGRQNQFGFLAGGGVEQKLGRNFSIGLEYMYHQYQDDDYRVRVGAGTAPATNPFILPPNTTGTDIRRSDDKFRWHSMRATAAFRF